MREFRLRIKLMLSDRVAGFCYIAAVVVMLVVLSGLNLVAEERSTIPIGLICNDDTPEAKDLCERIRANETFLCYDEDYDTLIGYMLDGYVNSIIVIPEGYGATLRRGRVEELVSITSVEDDRISVLVSDIVAGCMMHSICVNKTFNRYAKLGEAIYTRDGMAERISELEKDPGFTYSFDVSFVDTGSETYRETEITNGMLYRQAIACMLAMLMALVIFCSCNGIAAERSTLIRARRRSLPIGRLMPAVREICAVWVYSVPVALISAGAMGYGRGCEPTVRLAIVNLIFTAAFAIFYYLCSVLVRGIFMYQLIGACTVIVFGGLGFVYVLSGLLGAELMAETPFAVYIQAFMNII